MTAKEQLIPEIESILKELINEFLDLICLSKNGDRSQTETSATTNENIGSYGSDWWDNLDIFTPDFMCDRSQPNLPNREDIFT